ncbi:hypothetical protein [Serratia marcescens]|uniref:hypothetical protein n=1 Tax=Serratia marcescens TaxID=615 RepID=UPI003204854D
MMITTPTREEILQVIEINAEKPTGWKFDPKTPFGRCYMQALELTVGELKGQLFDLLDPEIFYTKWTLRVAAALHKMEHLTKSR